MTDSETKLWRALSRSNARRWRDDIKRRAQYKCEVCRTQCSFTACVHHIIPVANRGTGTTENLIYLCPNCHALIHALDIHDNRSIVKWLHTDQKWSAKQIHFLLSVAYQRTHYDDNRKGWFIHRFAWATEIVGEG